MKIIISDTNVLFDIISIRALPEFFSLDYEICTTDFVLNEIHLESQRGQVDSFIRAKKLAILKLTEDEIDEVQALHTTRVFNGITDKSVLWKSIQLKCVLLTGDKKLRKEAIDWGIEVHGSIWVIDFLVQKGSITNDKGIEFLEILRKVNPSLPKDEIERYIVKYKS